MEEQSAKNKSNRIIIIIASVVILCAVIVASLYIGYRLGNKKSEEETFSESFSENISIEPIKTTPLEETATIATENTTKAINTTVTQAQIATQKAVATSAKKQDMVTPQEVEEEYNEDDYILYFDGKDYHLIEKSPEYKEQEQKNKETQKIVVIEETSIINPAINNPQVDDIDGFVD